MKSVTTAIIRAKFEGAGAIPRRALSIAGYTHAAVLVPLVATQSGFDILLTKRTETVDTHKGQISFPGGMVDPTDTDIVHTALREAEEEIGLRSSSIMVVGQLDDLATPTGYVITPIVGIIGSLPLLAPSIDEVAEVFKVPMDFFCSPANGRKEQREFDGKKHDVWYYDWDGKIIWGATAYMLRSLLKKLELL